MRDGEVAGFDMNEARATAQVQFDGLIAKYPERSFGHPRSARSSAELPSGGAAMTEHHSSAVLDVRGLCVEFPGRHGTVQALSDVSLNIRPGEILGVVGESGAGKSMTGLAVQGLLEPPGRVSGGEVWLSGRRIDQLDETQMQQVRGRQIGAIFQDPLTSLNPLFTIGAQLVETIRLHLKLSKADARPVRSSFSRKSAFRLPRRATITIRISSPAACVSASSSPWRSPPSRS